MADAFYSVFIFPVVQLIDIFYVFIFRVFHNPGWAVTGVSIVITLCTLPLYFMAEHWQKTERDTVAAMKKRTDKIKTVFKGDEQYMILSAYYRQNHYHPVYAMRSTLGLLVQVPFFIAAYSYLSTLPDLKGASFLFIPDLGAPDGLISIGSLSINLLPVIMTAINVASGMLYAWNYSRKEKIQLLVMAALFLVILYSSPSGLLLYWTLNNIFSLIKHLLGKFKKSSLVFFVFLCAAVLCLDIAVLFFLRVTPPKKIAFILLGSWIFFIPAIKKLWHYTEARIIQMKKSSAGSALASKSAFIISALILCLLAGLVIPSSIISSSAEEFSFIESYSTPFPFLLNTLLQALGIFFLWPVLIYFLFSDRIKIILSILITIFAAACFVNTFIFKEFYGFLTTNLVFFPAPESSISLPRVLLNTGAILCAALILIFLLFYRKRFFFQALQIILLVSLTAYGLINTIQIQKDYSIAAGKKSSSSKEMEPVYSFSKTGKNVLFIMIDAAIGSFTEEIFTEKPELNSSFSGFTWYPNTASFGNITLLAAPPLFGSYYYTPMEINKRKTERLRDKTNEAYTILPRLFNEAGFDVTVTDIFYVDSGIYDSYENIKHENITGKYSTQWLKEHPELEVISISRLLKDNLLRLSWFNMAPSFMRGFLYDDGAWFTRLGNTLEWGEAKKVKEKLTLLAVDSLSVLDYLPRLTTFNENENGNFSIVVNELCHDAIFFEYPDYEPVSAVTNKGTGPYSQHYEYHSHMKTYLLLAKWFDYLKENGVYDNTRIIIAADHGRGGLSDPKRISTKYARFNPLLLVKDFNAQGGGINVDNSFMTNADAPLLALEGITDAVNPFTNEPMKSGKSNGALITTLQTLTDYNDHGLYSFKIPDTEWVRVKDNISIPENWNPAGPEK